MWYQDIIYYKNFPFCLQSLTAEQQERIERNKRLAMEKRMKKMGITPGRAHVYFQLVACIQDIL